MLLAIGLVTFAAAALFALAILGRRQNPLLRRIMPDAGSGFTRDRRLQGSFAKRTLAPTARRFGELLQSLLPHNAARSLERLLVMADEPMSLPAFLVFWALTVLAGGLLLSYVAVLRQGLTPFQLFGLGVLVVPLTILMPYALIRRRARARRRSIARDLPDALDLLVTSVEAGLGVDAAFAMVVEKTTGPLSDTFSHYLKEVGLGRSRREALVRLAERTGVPDLMRLASSVVQAEEVGATLGDVLRVQAGEMRSLRRRRAQEAAQRAPVLMTIPLALCFLPAMIAVVIVPSILNLVRFIDDLGSA